MDFSGVNFIEECHHDKCVEDDGEVLSRRRVKTRVSAAVNVEDDVSCLREC